MPFAKMLNQLTEEELGLLLDYQWEKYVSTHSKADGKPGNDQAKRNWLLKRAKLPNGEHRQLTPYLPNTNMVDDDVRRYFGLPSRDECWNMYAKVSYPKLPSVTEMWVNNPVRAAPWTNKKAYGDRTETWA